MATTQLTSVLEQQVKPTAFWKKRSFWLPSWSQTKKDFKEAKTAFSEVLRRSKQEQQFKTNFRKHFEKSSSSYQPQNWLERAMTPVTKSNLQSVVGGFKKIIKRKTKKTKKHVKKLKTHKKK